MSAALRPAEPGGDAAAWSPVAQALRRAALAVAQPSGPTLFDDLVRELAASLNVPVVFVSVFEDESRTRMHTLATMLDGKPLRSFDYALAGSPCAHVVGREFHYMACGVAAEFPPGSLFGAKGMDSYAAFPLVDSAGMPLGLLVAMDRTPIADAALAEAMLKIFASRIAAEIERSRADEALRAAALAVSRARGESVFGELVRLLATILHVDMAFIARSDDAGPLRPDATPAQMVMIALYRDGTISQDIPYALAATPCETVIGQGFRAYPARLTELFPDGPDLVADGLESYAGYPLSDLDGKPLGLISVASRRPLLHVERVQSMMQIFALRAAAEIERLRADDALRRSEASYRAIFESAEDAIFIHDWDSGAIVDANPKASATYGFSVEELRRMSVDEVSSGVPPYTGEAAQRHLQQARLGQAQRFEWQRRNRDGSLHWDEVVLKRATINGTPSIVGFGRDITQRKAAENALKLREQQFRAVFEASSDAFVLRDGELRVIEVNPAFVRLTGVRPQDLATPSGYPEHFPAGFVDERLAMLRRALAGEECHVETTLLRVDGSRFEADLRVIPVRYAGRPHVLSVVRDITERKAAEAALKLREEQYRVIFEAASDGFVLRDSQMSVVDVNPAYLRMSGFTREHVESNTGYPLSFPSAHVAERHALVRRGLAGESMRVEMELLRADGSAFDAEVRVVPVRHRGAPHVLSVVRDITERKQAEAALMQREEQYRVIFEAASDAFILRDAQLRIVDANPAYLTMTGFTRADLESPTGYPADFPADYVAERHDFVRRALAGERFHVEVVLLRADRTPFDAEVRVIPVRYRGEPHVLSVVRDITERKTAERALLLREEQYRAIFDASTDALVLWSRDIRIVDVNRAFCEMYGYRREDVVGGSFGQRLSPEEVEYRVQMIRRVLAGEEVQFETGMIGRDGQRFEAELRAIPLRYRGEPHALSVIRDITERKQAELALKRREEQYRAVFDGVTDALVLWSRDMRIVDVNRAYTPMYGLTREESLGAEFGVRLPRDEVERRTRLFERALAGQETQVETESVRANGERFEVELRYLPIQHRGEPHVLAVSREITERKRAERALALREEQYRAIFDGSADSMVLWSRDVRVVDVNAAFCEIYGYTREQVIGGGFGDRLSDAEVEHRSAMIRRALAGEPSVIETTTVGSGGRRFDVELRYLPIRYRGEPHVLGVARDISARKLAEAQRNELEAQLRQAQKMEAIGQLTGGIAHDFNNILTSVIGYVVLASERAEGLGDAALVRQLGQAHLAAQRARELIAQMLTFARRQRGARSVLALPGLVRQTVQLLRATLPASIDLDAQCDEEAAAVEADAVQLEQVLFNLCINARDAISGAGRIHLRLREVDSGDCTCASCRVRVGGGRWVELAVSDSGSGIAPEVLERMFDPFYTTKEVGRGSGMGLAMVHGIVHDHGGHLCVDTRPGAGSTFRVLLPPTGAQAGAAAGSAPLLKPAARPPLRGRVLLVEDEPLVGEFMRELLGGWGLDVQWQRDPLQALAWLGDPGNATDLLITDQTMPGLTGLELAERVRPLRPALPVLLYTGNAAELEAAQLKCCGVDAALRKPVDPEALRAVLRRMLTAPRDTPTTTPGG